MQAKFIANNVIAIILLSLGAIFGAAAMYLASIIFLILTLISIAITIWALKGFRGNILLWIILIIAVVFMILGGFDASQNEIALKISFYGYCVFLFGYSFHLFKEMDAFYDKAKMFGMLTAGLYGTAGLLGIIVGIASGNIQNGYIAILVGSMLANALRVVFIVFGFSQV